MKTKIITILAAVMLLLSSQVQAIDIDFYSDATIEDGDVYDIVSVYDTPPNYTIVDMYGGSVITLRTYHLSIANIHGGEIAGSIETRNSSTMNIHDGSITLDYLSVSDSGTLNVHGGDLNVGNAPYFSESSTVNIYGYGFDYDGWALTGFLQDGSPLIFTELAFDKYSHMNLIEVPEPLVAEIDIKPTILNLASKGKWVTCYIRLPEEYDVAEIDPETILLEQRVKADWAWFNEQQQVAMVKFSRSELVGILKPGEVELTVTGRLVDGTYFDGTDTIKVIDRGHKND